MESVYLNLECGCNLLGAVNASCHEQTGQCYCRPGVVGRTCSECAVNNFLLFFEWTRILLEIFYSAPNYSLHFLGSKAKGRVSKRLLQENMASQIFRKTNISYPMIRTRLCAYQEGKKWSFFGKFGVLFFLVTPVLRFLLLPFA